MSSDNDSLSGNEVEVRSQNNDFEGEVPIETETFEDRDKAENNQQVQKKKLFDNESKNEPIKPRRKQLYPTPKFNEQTLKTAKGLPAILNHFKDIKFKGRGHEDQDLNRLMKTYEHWCHRLYPKFTFDDSIQKLEVLGNKKSTQVYLKKIRMGMENLIEEVDEKILSENDEDDIPTGGFVEPFDDRFDQLLSKTTAECESELANVSSICGESSSMSNLNIEFTRDNVTEDTQVDGAEQLELDDILDIINEDDHNT